MEICFLNIVLGCLLVRFQRKYVLCVQIMLTDYEIDHSGCEGDLATTSHPTDHQA